MKFIRIADVQCILSSRRLLSTPIIIKPNMTAEERHRESVLLKKRWKVIQSGIPKNINKMQGSCLYFRNKLYGQITNSTFVLSSASQSIPFSIYSKTICLPNVHHLHLIHLPPYLIICHIPKISMRLLHHLVLHQPFHCLNTRKTPSHEAKLSAVLWV